MPEKRRRSKQELLVTSKISSVAGRRLKITAPELARTLKSSNLELRGDGECFRVVSKE
jgi:hypothetical protein